MYWIYLQLVEILTLIILYLASVSAPKPKAFLHGLNTKSYYGKYALDAELPIEFDKTYYFIAKKAANQITLHALQGGGKLQVIDPEGPQLIWYSERMNPHQNFKAFSPIPWHEQHRGPKKFVMVSLPTADGQKTEGRCGSYDHEVLMVLDEDYERIWSAECTTSSP